MCPYKIADGSTAKAAHPSWIKNLLFECRGDLRSPEVVSVTAAHPSVAAEGRGARLSLLQREKVPRNEADEVLVT